jgi:hypothetical protein
MNAVQKGVLTGMLFFVCLARFEAAEKTVLALKGSYLVYSNDLNQIYGEKIEFYFLSYHITSDYIKCNLTMRLFCAYGNVVVRAETETFQADRLEFDPVDRKGVLISYGDKIQRKPIGEKADIQTPEKSSSQDNISLTSIKKSFIYFVGQSLEITEDLKVIGINVVLYVEGIESLGFKKLNLSKKVRLGQGGFSLDRIWFTRSQGIMTRISYNSEKKDKLTTFTRLNYEERSVLKNYQGLRRQVDIMSSTIVGLTRGSSLGVTGNYNTSGLWTAQLWLNRQWNDKISTKLDFQYDKPVLYNGEAWLGIQSSVNASGLGVLTITGRYGSGGQILASFQHNLQLLKSLQLNLSADFSKLRFGNSGDYSKILNGRVNLSYFTRIFNLSTNYYLNSDLLGSRLLSQPQLDLSLNPFSFYGDILTLSITNIFIYSNLTFSQNPTHTFSNNTVLDLSTEDLYLGQDLKLNLSFQAEQFIEKEKRNFTSGGLILRANQELGKVFSLEGLYSFRSRRKTKNWLVEGTTSQDLTLIMKLNAEERTQAWLSLSYDPKSNRARQSFADVSVGLFRNWSVHTLMNYDFLLKRLINIDLYIIRQAGRFQLRFVWRSLSKQFLAELVPR